MNTESVTQRIESDNQVVESTVVQTKLCPKCGKVLPTTDFYANSHNKDGLQDKCKECQKKCNREYHKKRREKFSEMVESEKMFIDEKEHTMIRVYSNPELARYTPRQLMAELKCRGYRWDYMLEPQRKIHFEKI